MTHSAPNCHSTFLEKPELWRRCCRDRVLLEPLHCCTCPVCGDHIGPASEHHPISAWGRHSVKPSFSSFP